MIRRLALCALALAAAPGAGANAVTSRLFDDGDRKVATPRLIVQPDFPRDALAAAKTGHVDVEAWVNAVGGIVEPTFVPDSPASTVFVAALREVIGQWVFYPAEGHDCQPVARRVRFRVWFEIDAGKGKISMERAVMDYPQRAALKRLSGRKPDYPVRMLHAGYEANVHARVELEPEGSVRSVTAVAYPERQRHNLSPFVFAVKEALMGWRYPPKAPDEPDARAVCIDVEFRIRD